MKRYIAYILLLALLFLRIGCSTDDRLPQITVNNVGSIELWTNQLLTEVKLTDDEMKAFVKLYNRSQYHSEGIGTGGTPEYGAVVHYKGGRAILVNEFNGNDAGAEVSLYSVTGEKAWCYVSNSKLSVYMAQLLSGNHSDS